MGYSLLTLAVPAAAWFIPVAAVNVLVVLTLLGIGMAGLWAGMHAIGTSKKLTWKALLSPFDAFGQPVAAQVVSVLFFALGLILILPGLLALQGLRFAMPLVVIHKVPFWEAMKTSWRITRPDWWKWLAFDLLCLFILALGALAGGIGLLVALPVVMGARYASFRAVMGE